jgi:rubrerythrin
VATDKRLPVAEASRGSYAEHPLREQMMISVSPIIRGEREDIGLLSDELQDHALDLANEVDNYNSHIETLPKTPGGPISVDEPALHQLRRLRDRANSLAQELSLFIENVRKWRCQRCKSFIDEILDLTGNGQTKRCPICNDTTRVVQLTPIGVDVGAQANPTVTRTD